MGEREGEGKTMEKVMPDKPSMDSRSSSLIPHSVVRTTVLQRCMCVQIYGVAAELAWRGPHPDPQVGPSQSGDEASHDQGCRTSRSSDPHVIRFKNNPTKNRIHTRPNSPVVFCLVFQFNFFLIFYSMDRKFFFCYEIQCTMYPSVFKRFILLVLLVLTGVSGQDDDSLAGSFLSGKTFFINKHNSLQPSIVNSISCSGTFNPSAFSFCFLVKFDSLLARIVLSEIFFLLTHIFHWDTETRKKDFLGRRQSIKSRVNGFNFPLNNLECQNIDRQNFVKIYFVYRVSIV